MQVEEVTRGGGGSVQVECFLTAYQGLECVQISTII